MYAAGFGTGMPPRADPPTADFDDAVRGLLAGDFSRLEPLFRDDSGHGPRPRIIDWCERDLFRDQPRALAEALTCACFVGSTTVAEYLLQPSVDPAAGAATGLDALHWAVNRGQRETTRLLLKYNPPLESRNRFGGNGPGDGHLVRDT
jgi:ankyrin repeat protein